MKLREWLLAFIPAAIAVIVLTGAAAAQVDADAPPKNRTDDNAQSPPSLPGGWIVVADDLWRDLVDELDHHLQAGYEDLNRKDNRAAAREIRKGMVFVKLEAARASGADRKTLDAEAAGLEKLADGLGQGTVPAPGTIERAFATAHGDIARNHLDLARADWSGHDAATTGQELKAAITHLRQGLKWADRKLGPDEGTAVVDAEGLAESLAGESGWKVEDVEQALKAVSSGIDVLGAPSSPPR